MLYKCTWWCSKNLLVWHCALLPAAAIMHLTMASNETSEQKKNGCNAITSLQLRMVHNILQEFLVSREAHPPVLQ